MFNLFLLLFLGSLIALVAGLISPAKVLRWNNASQNRKQVLKIFGASILISFIAMGFTTPDVPNATNEIVKEVQEQTEEPIQLSEEQREVAEAIESEPQVEENQETNDTPQGTVETPSKQEKIADNTVTYTVQRVIDGDTIELNTGERVRYIGINTPETKHPSKGVECFGPEASKFNTQLVKGKTITMEKDVSDTDRYGRLLRYIYVDDLFVNLELVKQGYAYSSSYPPDVKHQDRLREAESYARSNKLGLWNDCQEKTNTTTTEQTPQPTVTQITTPEPEVAEPTITECNIKGNISNSGEKIYHYPGCASYTRTKIDESKGERWFCTKEEAVAAEWREAKNCN